MNWLKAALRVVGPRLIAAISGVVVAKAAQKGLTLDPVEVTGIVVGAYAGIHRIISSKVNPGDSAKGRLVTAEKDAVDVGGQIIVEDKR